MTLRQDLGGETRPYHKIKPKTIRSRLRVCTYVANRTVVPERLRNSIFKKPADNPYLGGFWGEKARDANGFSI